MHFNHNWGGKPCAGADGTVVKLDDGNDEDRGKEESDKIYNKLKVKFNMGPFERYIGLYKGSAE